MRHIETIIVGGGPAGATCAWKLNRLGQQVLILDKAEFPREKLCAGWITSKVLRDLEFTPSEYPHSFLEPQIHCHITGLPFALPGIPTGGKNYSVRRIEFDHWMLQRSQAEVIRHDVKSIRVEGDKYIVDELYSCRNLVGAGGTACPVRRLLFPKNRRSFRQVVTLEREFKYPARDDTCHLYFGQFGSKGYAWYFPKANGFVNIGLGGKANYFKRSGASIHQHFSKLLSDLVGKGLLDASIAENLQKSGHPYYLHSEHGEIKKDRCFLIGDAAGLATVDLGEGIGPAIESGLLTAGEIMGTEIYSKDALTRISTAGLIGFLFKKFSAARPHSPPGEQAARLER